MDLDAAVVGAGVVGLATARALALRGHSVLVLEAEDAIGTGISSRNSGVIHAGLYYPTGSAKARLCVAGRRALYRYAAERGVPHARIGKLVVATADSERPALEALQRQARANDVEGVRPLSAAEVPICQPPLQQSVLGYSCNVGRQWKRGHHGIDDRTGSAGCEA